MELKAYEEQIARAILYVALGICDVEFPTTHRASYSTKVLIVRNTMKGDLLNGVPIVFTPMRMDAILWSLIAQRIPELAQMMTQADHHQAYYEVAYERLIAKGFTFHALDITGLNWTEIDTHCDFVSANKMFAIPPRARAPKHQHLLNTASIRGFRRV